MRRIANVLGYSVCQVISCVITKQSLASSFYTFFLAFIYIFGGTAIPTKNINESTRWLFDISPYYYVFKGLAINEYENTENAAYLQKQNLQGNKWRCFTISISILVLLRILVFILLLKFGKERK